MVDETRVLRLLRRLSDVTDVLDTEENVERPLTRRILIDGKVLVVSEGRWTRSHR